MIHYLFKTVRKKLNFKNKKHRFFRGEGMKKFSWLNDINREAYKTPVLVKNDKDYFPHLKTKITSFISDVKKYESDKHIVSEIEDYSNNIVLSLEQYYKGNIMQAQETVKKLLSSFSSAPAVTSVNECIGLFHSKENDKIQFFRARLSENVTSFKAKDMLHIPFSNRDKIKSERFGVPGLPCLYLANTSYCCWLEMGSPAEHKLNVSPFELDNTFKILNLNVSFGLLRAAIEELEYNAKNDSSFIIDLFKLFLLTLSTSFRVESKDRYFKSEYILSQLIMLAAKDMGIDGISYLSKQADDDMFAIVSGINVVLFATYNGEENLSAICEHIKTDDSFNYYMFNQLLPSMLYKEYELSVSWSPYINTIGRMDRQIPYNETKYYEFDKYIFANAELKQVTN